MKKGQLYILASLILIVIIYGMVTVANKASQENIGSDFEGLSENYAVEGAKLINQIKEQGGQEDVITAFRDYTQSFTSYSKTKSSEFGLVYAFYYTGEGKDIGKLYIGNYLNIPMLVSYNGKDYTFVEGCYSAIPAGVGFDGISLDMNLGGATSDCETEIPPKGEAAINKLYITLGGYGYTFDIKPDQLEIIIVSREDHPDQRKVFVGGDLANAAQDQTLFSEYCETGGTTGCQNGELICSAAYLTEDDCSRDPACQWDQTGEICKNV